MGLLPWLLGFQESSLGKKWAQKGEQIYNEKILREWKENDDFKLKDFKLSLSLIEKKKDTWPEWIERAKECWHLPHGLGEEWYTLFDENDKFVGGVRWFFTNHPELLPDEYVEQVYGKAHKRTIEAQKRLNDKKTIDLLNKINENLESQAKLADIKIKEIALKEQELSLKVQELEKKNSINKNDNKLENE